MKLNYKNDYLEFVYNSYNNNLFLLNNLLIYPNRDYVDPIKIFVEKLHKVAIKKNLGSVQKKKE